MIFAGELGVPTIVPVEIALLLVGSHAVHSPAMLIASVALATVADVLGTTSLYLLAQSAANRLTGRLLVRHAPASAAALAHWRARLGGREAPVVFVVRMLPLLRMPAAIAAALVPIRLRRFLLGAAPAALIWAGTPLVLGYRFRADVSRFEERYALASRALLLILPALAVVGSLAWWIRRGRSPLGQLQRARAAVSLAVAVLALGYVVYAVQAINEALDHGAPARPDPMILGWLGVVLAGAMALVGMAALDLETRHANWRRWCSAPRLATFEAGVTIACLGLIACLGALVAVLERRYLLL